MDDQVAERQAHQRACMLRIVDDADPPVCSVTIAIGPDGKARRFCAGVQVHDVLDIVTALMNMIDTLLRWESDQRRIGTG